MTAGPTVRYRADRPEPRVHEAPGGRTPDHGQVGFRGAEAELVLPPTSSVDAAAQRLTELPTGGRTPLTAGLMRAADVLRVERSSSLPRPPSPQTALVSWWQ